jgi:hypothetical protein
VALIVLLSLAVGCGDSEEPTTVATSGATGASGASGPSGPGAEVEVTYAEPKGGENAFGAELVKANKFELIAGNLATAFELPEDLTVRAVNGFGGGPFFDPRNNTITFPYGWANLVYDTFDELHPEWTEYQIGSGVGALDSFVLEHEFAHALISIYDLPVLGREEDAADDLATLLLLKADGGEKLVLDAAQFWAALSDRQRIPAVSDYADVHSLDLQRALSMLCHVAGSSKGGYQRIASMRVLPQSRLPGCPAELRDKALSFDQVLDPHLQGDFTLAE